MIPSVPSVPGHRLHKGRNLKPLRLCVAPKEIWNPARQPRERIRYVELSNIDSQRGLITGWSEIPGHEAPSRAKKIIRAGDVLFATTRPNLKNIAIVPPELNDQICSTGFCVLRPKPDVIETGWLFAACRSDIVLTQILKHDEKNAYPSVSDDEVLDALIPVPPLDEQRRIVARIEALTIRLEQARQARQAAILEAVSLSRSVISATFDTLDETPTRKLGDIAGIIGGNSIPEDGPRPESEDDRVGLMKVSDMNTSGNESVIASCRIETTRAYARAQRLRVVPRGAIVFPKRGGAIATNKKRKLAIPAALDPNMMGVFPIEGSGLSSEFLRCWFESIDLSELQEDGGIPQVNKKHLDPLEIPVPTLPEQRRIVDRLDALAAKQSELRRLQSETEAELDAFTPALLAKAFRGEL